MTFIEKIKLAFYNLTHRKKTTAQCVLMMSFIMVLVFISSFFIATLTIQLNDGLNNYVSKNYINISKHTQINDYVLEPDDVYLNQNKQNEIKEKFKSISAINYYKYPLSFWFPHPAYCNFILDEVSYKTRLVEGDTSYWESSDRYANSNFSITCKDVNTPTFSQNLRLEFSKKFPNEKLIKYGRDIENENEVLFPEEYLRYFEVTPEQLLAAESVTMEGLFYDAKVAGITNGNLSMLYPGEDGEYNPSEYIKIYAGLDVLFLVVDEWDGNIDDAQLKCADCTYQRIELQNTTEVEDILEYLREEFDGITENEWDHIYSINYANHSKFNELDTISKILTFVWNVIIILFFVLGVGLVVFLYSVMEHSAKQKGAYFGMMRAMGEKSTLSVTIIETIILTVFAAVICLIISSAGVFALSGTIIKISWNISYEFIVSKGLFVLVFFLTLFAVAALNIFVALLSSRHQNKMSITEALKN